jgi:hypothetical protein
MTFVCDFNLKTEYGCDIQIQRIEFYVKTVSEVTYLTKFNFTDVNWTKPGVEVLKYRLILLKSKL